MVETWDLCHVFLQHISLQEAPVSFPKYPALLQLPLQDQSCQVELFTFTQGSLFHYKHSLIAESVLNSYRGTLQHNCQHMTQTFKNILFPQHHGSKLPETPHNTQYV